MFRVQTVDGLEQQSCPMSPHTILKNPLSSSEVNPSRHVLHAPVPCRPQPIKSNSVVLQWGSPPSTNQLMKASAKSPLLHLSNMTAGGQHDNQKRQGFGHSWHRQTISKPSEPTVLFRLKSLSENVGGQIQQHSKAESSPVMVEKVSADGAREVLDGPLDLSDRGKSKPSQSPSEFLPAGSGTELVSPDRDVTANSDTYGSSSPRSGASPSTPPRATSKQCEGEEPEGQNQTKVRQVCVYVVCVCVCVL